MSFDDDDDDDNGSSYDQDEMMDDIDEEGGVDNGEDENEDEMDEDENEDGDGDDDDEGDDDEDGDGDGDGDGDMDEERDGEGDGDGDGDRDGDGDGDENGDGDGDGENEGDSEEESGDDTDRTSPPPSRSRTDRSPSKQPGPEDQSSQSQDVPTVRVSPPHGSDEDQNTSRLRPEMVTASIYDIVPTIAAPQSTSVNAVCATADTQWIFTAGSDGYIRKFNWVETVNGKLPLTVAQRHPFVDSVHKAGVLSSYWDSEELLNKNYTGDDYTPCPVYSLAVQKQALWILSGLESGTICLQTVRHGEGSVIAYLREHKSAVSVLSLAPNERTVLSGSWDKTVRDWDLNTGQTIRTFTGGNGHISSIHRRPTSSVPVPPDPVVEEAPSGTFSSNNNQAPVLNEVSASDPDAVMNDGTMSSAFGDPAESPDDLGSLFGESRHEANEMMMSLDDDDDDEFSRAIADGLRQQREEEEAAQAAREFAQSKNGGSNNTAATAGATNGSAPGDAAKAKSPSSAGVDSNGKPLPTSDTSEASFQKFYSSNLDTTSPSSCSETTFLESCMDGSIRIWDKRQPSPVATSKPVSGTPAWCMEANWSWDGNMVYAGRRNNVVEEYSLHKSFAEPVRSLRLPPGSGPVSSVLAMPNGRHLVCASHDILRLYDLQDGEHPKQRQSTVPFLIVPGHRTGVISQLFLDPTCSFMISVSGSRGWDGVTTEVLLGYEILIPK